MCKKILGNFMQKRGLKKQILQLKNDIKNLTRIYNTRHMKISTFLQVLKLIFLLGFSLQILLYKKKLNM